ncbi:hypothetical protein E2C01_091671 [Portunus trituberculatus]|uniref:Uncharacterized protein n=1 Tax=Portunus trituberculatus TaxID=210409 RepID=A0A5B7JPQ3_PORTR|nr:hypothetical protein [Portunus trituberculatus]
MEQNSRIPPIISLFHLGHRLNFQAGEQREGRFDQRCHTLAEEGRADPSNPSAVRNGPRDPIS